MGYQYNPLLSRGTAGCGHSCTLSRLVPYLHDRGGKVCCPVCQSTLASVICDSSSSAFLLQSQEEHRLTKKEAVKEDDGRIISFRYGAAFYYLWVPSSPPLPSSSYSKLFGAGKITALDRIGSVLGMNVGTGLKVIHKGKVIYPENAEKRESPECISEQLLDISYADLLHRRKKPSLVVTGLRQQTTVGKQTPAARNHFIGIMTRFTPWYLFRWAVHTTAILLGGMYLFMRSIFRPPQPV